jgi:hypothetical protein
MRLLEGHAVLDIAPSRERAQADPVVADDNFSEPDNILQIDQHFWLRHSECE